MTNLKNTMVFLFAGILLLFIIIAVGSQQPAQLRQNTAPGVPYCFQNDTWFAGNSEKFCVHNGYLYLLYSDKDILSIYDTDGVYQKSYAFVGGKGQPSVRMNQDSVFLFDENRNRYTFSAGEWINYEQESGYSEYIEFLKTCVPVAEQTTAGDTEYTMKWMSIYRVNPDGTETQIVKRLLFLKFLQGPLPFVGMVLCWLGFAGILLYLKLKGHI